MAKNELSTLITLVLKLFKSEFLLSNMKNSGKINTELEIALMNTIWNTEKSDTRVFIKTIWVIVKISLKISHFRPEKLLFKSMVFFDSKSISFY